MSATVVIIIAVVVHLTLRYIWLIKIFLKMHSFCIMQIQIKLVYDISPSFKDTNVSMAE